MFLKLGIQPSIDCLGIVRGQSHVPDELHASTKEPAANTFAIRGLDRTFAGLCKRLRWRWLCQ